MAISKRYEISANPAAYRAVEGFGARPVSQSSNEEVWPIRRAVWFWVGLSAVGWVAIAGLLT